MGVEFREVNPKPGRTQFHHLKLRRSGILQALRIFRGETQRQLGTQVNHNLPVMPVVSSRHGVRKLAAYALAPLVRQFNFTMCNHVCLPMPDKAREYAG